MKLIPHSQIQMLGVPLGNDIFVSEFVEAKLLGRLSKTVERLVEFEDTQAATYLLRVLQYRSSSPFHAYNSIEQWKVQAIMWD